MLNSRVATLTKYGAQFPTMYMAPIEDGVFQGDSLRVYITNIDLKTLEIDEKTKEQKWRWRVDRNIFIFGLGILFYFDNIDKFMV